MATVDLYGGGAQRVRQTYTSALGRDASDDEVSNWLSGTYGHGSADNLDPVIAAIKNSEEAMRRQKPARQMPADVPGQVLGQQPNVSRPQPAPQQQPPSPIAPTPVPWSHAGWADANNQIQGAY